MKSALFVDFDNVFSGLRRLDPTVAERFAFQPLSWIRWLSEVLPAPSHTGEGAVRRLLVRRCYLNPQVYQRFRPAFNRAGFEIIDCPAMTSEGKTSTDIHMVLDIVDLLQHDVRYDEFIVFSADADFTPVLRKLRKWDRRTTVLAVGFPSAAYQASADLLIDQDDFVRDGLGFDGAEAGAPPAVPVRSKGEVAGLVAKFIAKAVAESTKPVALPWLASKAPAEVAGLDAANWAGFGSFRALVDSLKLDPLVVRWDPGVVIDPARHTGAAERLPAAAKPNANAAKGFDSVAHWVKAEVAKAGRPVPCSRLAQMLTDQFGAVAADWGGKNSFRKFVEALNLAPLKVEWAVGGGYITDPAFPALPVAAVDGATPSDWGADADLLPTMSQIQAATGLPLLSPKELHAMLSSLVTDLEQHPFQLSETGKRVRDRCREAGHDTSRSDVSFVLKGIVLGGHAFGEGSDDPRTLADAFVGSVLELSRREQLMLDDAQQAQVREWAGRAVGSA